MATAERLATTRGCEGPQPSRSTTAIKALIKTWRAPVPRRRVGRAGQCSAVSGRVWRLSGRIWTSRCVDCEDAKRDRVHLQAAALEFCALNEQRHSIVQPVQRDRAGLRSRIDRHYDFLRIGRAKINKRILILLRVYRLKICRIGERWMVTTQLQQCTGEVQHGCRIFLLSLNIRS